MLIPSLYYSGVIYLPPKIQTQLSTLIIKIISSIIINTPDNRFLMTEGRNISKF